MLEPCQCLLSCSPLSGQKKHVLLAASGGCIFTFEVDTGSLISTWPSSLKQSGIRSTISHDHEETDPEREAKRQKIAISRNASSSDSADIVVESKLDTDSAPITNHGPSSHVAKLISTKDCKHVVAITAEDKSIRVFGLSGRGDLEQISVRFDTIASWSRVALRQYIGQCQSDLLLLH